MKEHKTKLKFNKKDITELNKDNLNKVNGGTLTSLIKYIKLSNQTFCNSDAQ